MELAKSDEEEAGKTAPAAAAVEKMKSLRFIGQTTSCTMLAAMIQQTDGRRREVDEQLVLLIDEYLHNLGFDVPNAHASMLVTPGVFTSG